MLSLLLLLGISDRLLDLLLDQPLLIDVRLIERIVRIVKADELVAIRQKFVERSLNIVSVLFEGSFALRFGEAHVHQLLHMVGIRSFSWRCLSLMNFPVCSSISEGNVDS